MRSDRTYLRSIVTITLAVLVTLTALVFVQLLKPSFASAQGQTQNNTAVFSGQVIPAFIGTAYDPSYAYQRLAGMPIYVFAYDSWGGGAFVINGLAIRTQIRVDGSFQAQGLPNGNKYGVYFPFSLNGNSVTRTDCQGSAAPCQPGSVGVDSDNIPFRVPQPNNLDGIQDVFSYNLGNPDTTVVTQLGETINLGPSFLTQETKVDIENNTNTFPVVPTSTLRISTKELCHFISICTRTTQSAYEVVAQRVVAINPSATGNEQSYAPFIKGRTTFPVRNRNDDGNPSNNDRVFQAYAPPGVYAITIWRNDGGIVYSNYAVNSPLQSTVTGFGVMEISRVPDSAVPNAGAYLDDWSSVSARTNYIPLLQNRFIVWGLVYNPLGRPLNEVGSENTIVNIYSPQFEDPNPLTAVNKQRDGSCFVRGPWTYQPLSATVCADDTAPGSSYDNAYTDRVNISNGIYAFYDDSSSGLFTEGGAQRAISFDSFLSGRYEGVLENFDLDESTYPIDEVFSTYGPVRQDLSTAATPTTGIRFRVNAYPEDQTDNEVQENNSIKVLVAHSVDNTQDTFADDPIVQQSPYFIDDALGQIYFSPDQFLEGIEYRFTFFYPGAIPLVEDRIVVPDDDLIDRELDFGDATSIAGSRDRYKIFGFIPSRWLQPDPPVALAQGDCEEDEAKFIVYLKGANAYQSMVLKREGKPFRRYKESWLAQKTGDWSFFTCVPYTDAELVCGDLGTGYAKTDDEYEACEIEAARQNIFSYEVTADGETKGASTMIQWKEEQGDIVGPSANPPTATIEFDDQCKLLKEDLIQKLEARAEAEAVSFFDAPVEAIKQGFQKVFDRMFEVTFPVMGCNIGAGLTPLISNGFYAIRDQLILDPITTVPAVVSAWSAMRSIANFFFIFILLIIAINYILGVDRKTWNLGQLLPQMILGIILANTSLLITQALLDVNNVLTAWLFSITFNILETSGISSHAIGTAAGLSGVAAIGSLVASLLSGGIAGSLAAAAASGGTALIPILGFVISIIGVLASFVITIIAMLFGRVLIIWIIVIIAPIFFALSTLPWTSSLKGLWWKTIIPMAFMQTIITVLLSVGILLMSVPGESDSVLARASIFFAGGTTLFAVLKSPQLAMQLLGGGGLAGQAFGAVAGAASKVGGAASGFTTGTLRGAGKLVGGVTAEDRQASKERDDALKTYRPDMFEGEGIKGAITNRWNRLKGGGRNYQYSKYKQEEQMLKEQKQREKTQEKAEKTAVEMRKLEGKDGEASQFDQGIVRGTVAKIPVVGQFAGKLPGAQKARIRRKSEATKIPEAQMRVDLKMNQFDHDTYSAVANKNWYNTKDKYALEDSEGNTKAMRIPDVFRDVLAKLEKDGAITSEQRQKARKASSFNGLTHPEYGIGKDGFKVQKELLGRLQSAGLKNLQAPDAKGGLDMKQEGIRARSQYKQAKGVDIPAPSSGGGGDSGGK